MKIMYSQPKTGSIFEKYGVENCYFKSLHTKNDRKSITNKEHSHTCFEVHIMDKGQQIYEADNKSIELKSGDMLIIPPKKMHRILSTHDGTTKYSVTFSLCSTSVLLPDFDFVCTKVRPSLSSTIAELVSEHKNASPFSEQIIENLAFNIVAHILRILNCKQVSTTTIPDAEDSRLFMAKRYIEDNIFSVLSVSDVAAHCYLSTRQFTRLFQEYENITPAEYIRNKKIEQAEKLMHTNLSIAEISRKLNFSNQYNFHAFFKKHSGMTPGAYKRMLQK